MDQQQIQHYGQELYQALRSVTPIEPITSRSPEITLDDAYNIQLEIVRQRMELDGETIIGKKIGCTSKPVQAMLKVNQPDFGHLLSGMAYNDGDTLPISTHLMQVKAEGEIAFILKRDLSGPGITNADVLAATECVMPCFEICDSRIRDWQINIQDTVADNASSGLFVLGDHAVSPEKVDLTVCGMLLEKNGEVVATGAGAASLGSPVNAVAWLANTLGERGITLKAGEVILSGALAAMVPAAAGDHMRVTIGGIGSASVLFS
ncbi:MAG: 2-oxopent-4-enoate hydratase [Gammaproteobacteria bacterium]|nr:2-oxopent-4-enoate hydratase [Gammaproteobacteria bacterium]